MGKKLSIFKNCYKCPVCGYCGWFLTVKVAGLKLKHEKCPVCGSETRHRLQYLVFKKVTEQINTRDLSMLHFAPEKFFISRFRKIFRHYLTADLNNRYADKKEDLRQLSFRDNSFDFIFCSHVLEHIKEDTKAISEIKRVLKPGGLAIISVPVIGSKTIEYPEVNPQELFHVRCPGEDYYDKFREYFQRVVLYKSTDFDERYQLFIYEDRTKWPVTMPLRPSVSGEKHLDIVSVCFK
jgi:SAM-dependent methyltransferase